MTLETKSKEIQRTNRADTIRIGGCLVFAGMVIGFLLSTFLVDRGYIISSFHERDLRSVMETFYFGNGLADLTGDISVLEKVSTEYDLQRKKDNCSKDSCDDSYPPHVIGEYFRVVNLTENYAVVELGQRPIITDLNRKPRAYLRRCHSLIRQDGEWRVSGTYLNCGGYLPNKYK